MPTDPIRTIRTTRGREVDDVLDFVPVPEGKSGKVEVTFQRKKRQTPIPFSGFRTQLYGGDPEDAVRYPKSTTWRTLREEGYGVWMTDLPIEQYQMRTQMAPLRQARSVLVGGLGLGLAARVALRARGVERVVVVEKSPDVIALVEDAVFRLPELDGPLAPRLTILEADLFEYLRNTEDRYGWAWFDIWQSDGEGTFHEFVKPLRELATQRGVVPIGRVLCWNENVMRGQFAMSLTSTTHWARIIGDAGPDLPPAFQNLNVPTIEELAEPTGSVYHDWRVPFYRWVRDERPDPERARAAAIGYARSYAVEPAWLERWREGA